MYLISFSQNLFLKYKCIYKVKHTIKIKHIQVYLK